MDQIKINETIKTLCEKYKDDPFMSAKTENFICDQLTIILNNIDKNHAEQAQRISDLNAEQDTFIQGFLASNRYFYASNTENFFHYDGANYSNVTEDAVMHNVLTSISRDRGLMSWKYKTKSAIMKRIKDNSIFACIPESATIQSVLNSLYPVIFATKTEAKYFLTVLGDNILKKHVEGVVVTLDPLIHLLNPSAKTFINSINNMCQLWFGTNLNQSFKYKYHADHTYNQMRILSTVGSYGSVGSINLLCVACHYSNRYHSSDNYIVKYSNDDKLMDSVFFLKNISPETLVGMFVGEYISVGGSGQITWKNMLYLWKHFLESKRLPNAISQTKLRNSLITLMEQHYSEDDDFFVGISSKYLPTVYQFLRFWEETIVSDETEIELEIGEIATLYRRWIVGTNGTSNIGETQIVNILTHFFPELEIDQEKYIYKVRSKTWDKQVDIMMAMDDLRDKKGVESFATMSVYDAYVHYCDYMNGGSNASGKKRRPSSGTLTVTPLLVSKQYFEKYMTLNGNA